MNRYRILFLFVIVAVLTLAFSADKEINWFIVFQPWKAVAQEERINELELQLADANDLLGVREAAEAAISNLHSQAASLSSNLGSVQGALFQAQQKLARVLAAVASVETAQGTVTAFRFECCGSMEPYFGANDLVFLEWFGPYRVGDVVGALGDCNATHRIVSAGGGGFMVRGDAYPDATPCFVASSDVRFKVAAVARDVWW